MQNFPLAFCKGDPSSVVITIVTPAALRDLLKVKAINEGTTLQAIVYTAVRNAALDIPPPPPTVRCVSAIANYRDEIKAAYPMGHSKRKRLLSLMTQMETVILEDENA